MAADEYLSTTFSFLNLTMTESENVTENIHKDNFQTRLNDIFTTPGIVSYVLICLGTLLNTASILSLFHIRKRNLHLKILLNLAISDAGINIGIMIYDILYIFIDHKCGFPIRSALMAFFLIMTLLNLMALAIQQYASICYPLQYQRLLTTKKATMFILLVWLISFLCAAMDFIVGQWSNHPDYCTGVFNDEFHPEMLLIVFTFVVFFCLSVVYLRIFWRQQEIRVHDSLLGFESKTKVTTLLIIITFAICWLPWTIFSITMLLGSVLTAENFMTMVSIQHWLFILYQVNTLIDPILYAVRLQEVQNSYKRMFNKLLCVSQYSINEEGYRISCQGQHHQNRRHTTLTVTNDSMFEQNGELIDYSPTMDTLNIDISLANEDTQSDKEQLCDRENRINRSFEDEHSLTLLGSNKDIPDDMNESDKLELSNNMKCLILSPIKDDQSWPKSYGPG